MVEPGRRAEVARRWLETSGGVAEPSECEALAADACAIIGDPAFAELFAPGGMAEAPVAALVDGDVIVGTVDRLVVSDARVRIVDFKTGRRVPSSAETVPDAHLRQMAAYAAALAQVFPGRAVEATLLYTAGPKLIALPDALLAAHKPGFGGQEQIEGDGR